MTTAVGLTVSKSTEVKEQSGLNELPGKPRLECYIGLCTLLNCNVY